MKEFDFLGLLLSVGGVICILVGFNYSQNSWSDTRTIALLVVGGVLFILTAVNEAMLTNRNPIFPPRMFQTRTTAGLLLSGFFQLLSFTGASYYLPNYFQVLGASATASGVRLIPFSLGASLFAIIGGQIVSRTGKYRPTIWASWFIMVFSFVSIESRSSCTPLLIFLQGLLYLLDVHTSTAVQIILVFVAAIGTGPLFPLPLIGMSPVAAMTIY